MGIRIQHLYTMSLALLTDSSTCSYGGRGAGHMVSRFPESWGAYWRNPVPPTHTSRRDIEVILATLKSS